MRTDVGGGRYRRCVALASDPPGRRPTVRGPARHRRSQGWVVTDVQSSALPLDVAAASVGEGATFVSLSSVEGDGLGEELRVLWGLESGRRVLNRAPRCPTSARGASTTRAAGRLPGRPPMGRGYERRDDRPGSPVPSRGRGRRTTTWKRAIRALCLASVNLLVADDRQRAGQSWSRPMPGWQKGHAPPRHCIRSIVLF